VTTATGTVSNAITTFATDYSNLVSTIDPKTGTALGADFSLVVVAVSPPVSNADGSLKLTVIILFIPIGTVLTPTPDHERFYCGIIKNLLASVSGFKSTDLGDCSWIIQGTQKRAGSNTVASSSSNANAQAVSANYGSGSSAVYVSFLLLIVALLMSLL